MDAGVIRLDSLRNLSVTSISAGSKFDLGYLTGTESIANIQLLSRSDRNAAGQTTHVDSTFDLTGVTYDTPTSGFGSVTNTVKVSVAEYDGGGTGGVDGGRRVVGEVFLQGDGVRGQPVRLPAEVLPADGVSPRIALTSCCSRGL